MIQQNRILCINIHNIGQKSNSQRFSESKKGKSVHYDALIKEKWE